MTASRAVRSSLTSRLTPRLPPSALSRLRDELDRLTTEAPLSAYAIPDSVRYDARALVPDNHSARPGAVVRSVGTSRRVFVLNSSFAPDEISGLSYRIKALSSNDGINSVVVANPMEDADVDGDMSENQTVLSSFMEEGMMRESKYDEKDPLYGRGETKEYIKNIADERYGERFGMPYVSAGYDARRAYEQFTCDASSKLKLDAQLLTPVMELAEAMRGDFETNERQSESKVPVITLPNGFVSDAGYVMLSGSYALTTDATSYRMLNPLRGLTFDPVGLSYALPRCGREFHQESIARHSKGCAFLLALAGYEADASDLVSTGLATHHIGSPHKLNTLERSLMDINSYEGQRVKRDPRKYYGHEHEGVADVNLPYRNVAVGNVIQFISEYDAAGADEYGCYLKNDLDEDERLYIRENDPTLRMPEDRIQMYGALVSPLVDWAATFSAVFEKDDGGVEGIMERLREIASRKARYEGKLGYEEDVAVAEQAEIFVSSMEQRSPLALEVTHRLLLLGALEDGETSWRSCAEREKRAQLNLMTMKDGDFARWAESGKGVGLTGMRGKASLIRETEDVFTGWKHGSVKEVTRDEIDEIIGS